MKKLCLVLLALALCLPALAEESAEIALVPVGTFSDYADFEDDCARVIDTNGQYLEGVFDIQGNELIPCAYGSLEEYGECSYYTVQNENGVNKAGALNAAGELVIPMEYGDIDFLSERWALGVKLEETDSEDYDYEAFLGDEHYIVTAYDVYDLAAGSMVGSLARQQLSNANAYGDYLYIEDRSGTISIYDETLTAVGTTDSFYDCYASSDEGVISISTGEVVIPGYSYYDDIGNGLLTVRDDNYDIGAMDLAGNIVIPFGEYDQIYEYDANGYARVVKNDLYGMVDSQGNLVVPCEYDGFEMLNYGGGYVYGLNGYACVEKAGKYGYVSLATGEVTCPINYAQPTVIGLSMIVPDITGELYIIAADGTATPTTYAEFAPYPGGDGTLLKAGNAEGMWGLVDWHGNVLLDFTYSYNSAMRIAPDGSAVLAETEDGMAAYTVTRPGVAAVEATAPEAAEAPETVEVPETAQASEAEDASAMETDSSADSGADSLDAIQNLIGLLG